MYCVFHHISWHLQGILYLIKSWDLVAQNPNFYLFLWLPLPQNCYSKYCLVRWFVDCVFFTAFNAKMYINQICKGLPIPLEKFPTFFTLMPWVASATNMSFGSSIAFHLFTILHANNAEIFISSFMKVKNRFFGSVADQIGNIQWEWMCPTPDFKVKHFHEDMMKHFVRHNHIFEPE